MDKPKKKRENELQVARSSHVPATFQPRSSHVPATFQPRSSHVPATFQPRSSHVPAITRRRFDFTDAAQFYQLLGSTEPVGELHVIQTGPVHAIGRLVQVDMGTLRFQRLDLNMPWIRSIQPSGQWVTIVIPLCTGPMPIFEGRKIKPTQVAIYGPGSERFEIVEEGTEGTYFKISLDAGRANLEYLRAFGGTAPDLHGLCEVLDLPTDPQAWLESVKAIAEMATATSMTGVPLDVDLDAALTHIVLQFMRIVADLGFGRRLASTADSSRKHEEALLRCRNFIRDQVHRSFSIEELAAAAGYSERQLQHLFKFRLGISPLEYVRHFRLQKAREALKFSAGSVKEAALSRGFSEMGRFSVKYRSVFGESPVDTLHLRTAPRESGLSSRVRQTHPSNRQSSSRVSSEMVFRNASAHALDSGWRSGIPTS